jgi:biopolymer transport protein ExbD
MQFKRPARRQMAESVVPMINVVFLLLIFFMMSARIAPPPPFELNLPATAQDAPLAEEITLYISAAGEIGVQGRSDAQAWAQLATLDTGQSLAIRADAGLAAPVLAKTLAQLAGMGFASITLAVRAP